MYARSCSRRHELTLVDTLFEGDGRVVLEALSALGRQPDDLKHIVLTHAHRSHLGGFAALKRRAARPCSRTNGRRTSSPASAPPSP